MSIADLGTPVMAAFNFTQTVPDYLAGNKPGFVPFTGQQQIDAAQAVTNAPVPEIEGPRRAGDATRLVCGSDRARRDLGWKPARSDMATMLRDAHRWDS